MDRIRFDTLTRLLGQRGSRRGALGWLTGALAGLGLLQAEAGKRKKKRRRKRRRRRKKKNVCSGKNTCRKTAFCDSRAECACFVPEGGGKSFCGSAFPRTVSSCADCLAGETCVDLAGPGVPCNIPGLVCVERCANGK